MQNLLHMYNWCYYFNFSVNVILFDSMFMFCGSKVTNISAAQFNGTQCKENCQQLGLLRSHQTSKVSVHGKEFVSFQGLGDCLLELLLD